MTNEYKPWEAEGLTEIEYVRKRNLDLSRELGELDIQEHVASFHAKHGQPIAPWPTRLDDKQKELRTKLNFEECLELDEAIQNNDLVNIAKEGCDLIYVVLGLFVATGIDFQSVWKIVHENNMLKPVGNQGPDGKVLKPSKKWKKKDVRLTIARQLNLDIPSERTSGLGSDSHDPGPLSESEES